MQIKFCIYSIRRSGRHIAEEFLRNHLDYKFCNCCIDDQTVTKECYKTHVHLKHETNKHFNFNRIEKCIFLYRKDLVEQIDAILRLLYSQAQKMKSLDTTKEHTSCTIDPNISYNDIFSILTTDNKSFMFKNLVIFCNSFYKHVKENKKHLYIDFDSLVYTPSPQLRKIAEFLGYTKKTRLKKAIRAYLPSLREYTKKKMTYPRYVELMNIIHESVRTEVPKVLNERKLLVVSHGGSATTAFIEFIKNYIPTNCSKDLDGLKHTLLSKIEYVPSRIIYIYGDMDKTMRSLFRRKGGDVTIASIHEHKLKGIKHSIDLPANFEDFDAYTKLVTLENREPVGCLIHMRQWKKVPNVFFIHYEQICTSDTIDEYLDIPKGTCKQFTVMPRESEIQPCETPEYLETMKGLDIRVQGIINGLNV
jgi:hypothetical protein